MKISYNWLKTLVSGLPSPEETGRLLTGCGLEVENMEKYETVKGGLVGCVVGEVLTKEKHPDADKLSLTTVNIGTGTALNIVCGAPNVAAGQKVIVAKVGSTIYPSTGDPITLKIAKIRGALSEGMICAEDELGLGTSHAGILILESAAKVGMPASEYFKIETDTVFEIGLTPNRADAASHLGVARDLVALTGGKLIHQERTVPSGDQSLKIEVSVDDSKACPRYSGITLSGVTVKSSPDWLKRRLESIGLRSINNIVDATNFVLHELGQPLHAFDADKIAGKKVVVKKLSKGTVFTTLDGVNRKLDGEDLMICDAEKGMCMAGVFGGQHSGVTEQTKNIFLESAWFDAVHVRKTSKRHGLKTDASFRFERGTDPNITVQALKRAVSLIIEVAGGKVSSSLSDYYPMPEKSFEVNFTFSGCAKLIGKDIGKEKVKNILTALNIEIASEVGDALSLKVPPYKVDVKRECDVVEEVLRIYGYNNIPEPEHLRTSLSVSPKPDKEKIQVQLSQHLASIGYREIFTNSLTRTDYLQGSTTLQSAHSVAILNPLSSELGELRQTLLFSGLEAIAYNRNRKNPDLKLFELGKVYAKYNPEAGLGAYHEEEKLALFITGKNHAESWYEKPRATDIYSLKNTVEKAGERLGISIQFKEGNGTDQIAFGLEVFCGKDKLGIIGSVHPSVLKKLDISEPVYFGELSWTKMLALIKNAKPSTYREVPKFPEVRRDLAILLDKKIRYAELEKLAFETERKLLKEVNLFDVFEGEKIGKDKKSLALRFILQDETATLTDQQVDKTMERLMNAYREKLGADIRS